MQKNKHTINLMEYVFEELAAKPPTPGVSLFCFKGRSGVLRVPVGGRGREVVKERSAIPIFHTVVLEER